MARRIESLLLSGPAGKLEALLEEPEEQEPIEAALVCHPHPEHGGTMHNKVVYRMARALRRSGCVVLRFNYRGVNLSEGDYDHGIGELEDAKTALQELQTRYPQLPCLSSGFSFGSRIALQLAMGESTFSRVIAVGFPTKYPNREYVHKVKIPKYFVQSTQDEHGPKADLQQFFDSLADPKVLRWVEAEDHFFKGSLDAFENVIQEIGFARPTA